MEEAAVPLRWRYLVVQFPILVGILVVAGALSGGPLLSSTALVALPIAFAGCAAGLAYARHRDRVDPAGAERRLRRFGDALTPVTLVVAAALLADDPSWWRGLLLTAFAAAAASVWWLRLSRA